MTGSTRCRARLALRPTWFATGPRHRRVELGERGESRCRGDGEEEEKDEREYVPPDARRLSLARVVLRRLGIRFAVHVLDRLRSCTASSTDERGNPMGEGPSVAQCSLRDDTLPRRWA
jgi:hypothetical protein